MGKAALFGALVYGALTASAHGQVHRCTVDGVVQYQQAPCPGGASKVLPLQVTKPDPHAAEDANLKRLRENYLQTKAAADRAIATHCEGKTVDTPYLGMSAADLLCIPRYRKPDAVNSTKTASGESEQRVFRDRGRTAYIYITNGIVTAIQESN